MRCRKFRKMIPAVLEKESGLTQKEWLQFQLHINKCSVCKKEYIKYQKLFTALNELQSIPEPDHESTIEKIRVNIDAINIKKNWFKALTNGLQFNFRYAFQVGIFALTIGNGIVLGIFYRERIKNLYEQILTSSKPPIIEVKPVENSIVVPELPEVRVKELEEMGAVEPPVIREPAKITKRSIKETEPLPPIKKIIEKDVLTLRVLQAKRSGEQLKFYFNVFRNNKLIENISRENLLFQEYNSDSGWVENNNFELLPPGEKEPYYIVLILDYSDSMTPNLNLMERGAKKFIENLNINDRVLIIKFAEDVVVLTDGFINDKKLLYSAIDKRFMLRYSTSLYKAIDVGLNELKDKGDNKLLIVLTDGDDTHSNAFKPQVGFEDVYYKARALRIPLITVGLGNEIVVEKLSELAYGTAGMFIKVKKPEELIQVYNELGRTIVNTPCILVEYPAERYARIEKFKIVFRENDLIAETRLVKKKR